MLTALGVAMIVSFIALIMTQRLTALVALVLVPLAFGLVALALGLVAAPASGHGAGLGPMAMAGISKLAPTVVLLLFAVLYFCTMIDAGLFDPLVRRVVRIVGGDPLRVTLGTTVVVLLLSLDGDGASTALVTVGAFLPIYRRLGMNPLILALLLGAGNGIVNLTPWGGPTGRVAAALQLDPADVFLPLVPTMLAGMLATLGVAWYLGAQERRRLGVVAIEGPVEDFAVGFERDAGVTRPRMVVVNLLLTVAVLATGFSKLLPLPMAFMVGYAVAMLINYPRLDQQRARLAAHAAHALPIVTLILGAGVFTGILTGTGMIDAMAKTAAGAIPSAYGPWLAWITAVLSGPLTFMLPNDAYYFAVVPLVAQTAAEFGIPAVEIARASLLGQLLHTFSPLLAAIYLVAGLLRVEVGEMQRFGLKWALLLTAVLIVTAIATRAIT